MGLESIVDVNISRQTVAVSEEGFGTGSIFGPHVSSVNRVDFFTNTTSAALLFDSDDPIKIAIDAYFAQPIPPDRVAVLRQQVDVVKVSVDVVNDNTDYTTTINGADTTIDSGASATDITIATALAAAIDALGGFSAIQNGDGTYTVTVTPTGTAFSLKPDTQQSLVREFVTGRGTLKTLDPAETTAVGLPLVEAEEPDWYGLAGTSIQSADEDERATFIETKRKLHGTSSGDANITDQTDAADTTSVAARFKAGAFARSWVLFHTKPEQFGDMAWFGNRLSSDPGSSTWMFKTLATITVDKLTPTQEKNVLDKNANIYTAVRKRNITQNGTTAFPEFIDIIRGIDALQADLETSVFSLFVNLEKVPFTDPGVDLVNTEVKGALGRSVDDDVLTETPAPTVTSPAIADVSFTDRANRFLPDVDFAATVAGAIHAVEINGSVTV